TGFTLTTVVNNTPTDSTNGVVMWYHALLAIGPHNDAPAQLTEVTFRGTYYDPTINTTTGFQYLLGPDKGSGLPAFDTAIADYGISFVDSMNLPVALEAQNATVSGNTRAPFGWIGSSQSITDFQKAIQDFTSPNADTNGLGKYFGGGKGYPSYIHLDNGNLKLPAGQNVFLQSPVAPGGLADIFSTNPPINIPRYALTTAGDGPIKVILGGNPDTVHPSHGHFLRLNNVTDTDKTILSIIA